MSAYTTLHGYRLYTPVYDQQGVELAKNLIDGRHYPHHPALLQLNASRAFPLTTSVLSEWNGLLVPAAFDCDNFNRWRAWGKYKYFYEVPSRWTVCLRAESVLASGSSEWVPPLPIVDDEYFEQVAVYQSVLRSRSSQPYNVAELGARWGTWGSRAVAFLRAHRPQATYNLYFAESNQQYCGGIREVGRLNNMSFQLDCKRAGADDIRAWSDLLSHIDLIDMDIQGGERALIPALMDLLDAKVYRVIIGTHSHSIHRNLTTTFRERGWIPIWDVAHQHSTPCVLKYVRGNYKPPLGFEGMRVNYSSSKQRFRWSKLLAEGCYHNSTRGPVANWDGQLVFDNPAHVSRGRTVSLGDRWWRFDDLEAEPSSSSSDPNRPDFEAAFEHLLPLCAADEQSKRN